MKIYINKPKDNWLSPYTIVEKIIFWREIDYDEALVQNIIKYTKLSWFCDALYAVRSFFNRRIEYIKIDPWDVWSLDRTLSPIILPMLKELKRVKHGSPFVDDEDVPLKLRSNRTKRLDNTKNKYDQNVHSVDGIDSGWHTRFEYVLDEMIWTFEQLSMEDDEAPFFDHSESSKVKDITKSFKLVKVDKVGLKKHRERIDNGLRLFGKYYRALWD